MTGRMLIEILHAIVCNLDFSELGALDADERLRRLRARGCAHGKPCLSLSRPWGWAPILLMLLKDRHRTSKHTTIIVYSGSGSCAEVEILPAGSSRSLFWAVLKEMSLPHQRAKQASPHASSHLDGSCRVALTYFQYSLIGRVSWLPVRHINVQLLLLPRIEGT